MLTAEQKKARQEAAKTAKAAGKKGKEVKEAEDAAAPLTEDQKTKQAAAQKESRSLEKELKEKAMAVLTPEQKEQIKPAPRGGKKKDADKAAK